MALYRVTNIVNTGVGFSVEGSEDYTLAPGESIEVVKITQEIREFEETGRIRIDVLVSDVVNVDNNIDPNAYDKATSQAALYQALAGKEAAGTANNLLQAHVQDVNPHPQYALLADVIASELITFKFERITLTPEMITAKKVTLQQVVTFNKNLQLIPDGGIPQRYGVDYVAQGNIVSWDGYELDGFFEAGEIIDVLYTY